MILPERARDLAEANAAIVPRTRPARPRRRLTTPAIAASQAVRTRREPTHPHKMILRFQSNDQQTNSPLPATLATGYLPAEIDGGRYWDRTSDLFGVKQDAASL
jgi:hypothetical protein